MSFPASKLPGMGILASCGSSCHISLPSTPLSAPSTLCRPFPFSLPMPALNSPSPGLTVSPSPTNLLPSTFRPHSPPPHTPLPPDYPILPSPSSDWKTDCEASVSLLCRLQSCNPPDKQAIITAVGRVGSLARQSATNASLIFQLGAYEAIVSVVVASSPSAPSSPPSSAILKVCLRALTPLVKFLESVLSPSPSSSLLKLAVGALTTYLRDHDLVLVILKFLSKFLLLKRERGSKKDKSKREERSATTAAKTMLAAGLPEIMAVHLSISVTTLASTNHSPHIRPKAQTFAANKALSTTFLSELLNRTLGENESSSKQSRR